MINPYATAIMIAARMPIPSRREKPRRWDAPAHWRRRDDDGYQRRP